MIPFLFTFLCICSFHGGCHMLFHKNCYGSQLRLEKDIILCLAMYFIRSMPAHPESLPLFPLQLCTWLKITIPLLSKQPPELWQAFQDKHFWVLLLSQFESQIYFPNGRAILQNTFFPQLSLHCQFKHPQLISWKPLAIFWKSNFETSNPVSFSMILKELTDNFRHR